MMEQPPLNAPPTAGATDAMPPFPAEAFAAALDATGIALTGAERAAIIDTARFLHAATALLARFQAPDAPA